MENNPVFEIDKSTLDIFNDIIKEANNYSTEAQAKGGYINGSPKAIDKNMHSKNGNILAHQTVRAAQSASAQST